jgi:hypothetical protein
MNTKALLVAFVIVATGLGLAMASPTLAQANMTGMNKNMSGGMMQKNYTDGMMKDNMTKMERNMTGGMMEGNMTAGG